MKILYASESEIDWLIEKAKDLDCFYPSEKQLFDENEIRKHFVFIIEHGLVLVAWEKDRPVGFMSGVYTPHIYNGNLIQLVHLMWWVDIDYRNTRIGHGLLKRFNEEGHKNADWIILNIPDQTMVKVETFEKMGFKAVERTYLREVFDGEVD